jgi:hypothetical protein
MGAVLTLAALMQIIAKVNWAEVFKKKQKAPLCARQRRRSKTHRSIVFKQKAPGLKKPGAWIIPLPTSPPPR